MHPRSCGTRYARRWKAFRQNRHPMCSAWQYRQTTFYCPVNLDAKQTKIDYPTQLITRLLLAQILSRQFQFHSVQGNHCVSM